MRALSVAELLTLWEQGQQQPLVERGLMLLAAACPEYTRDAVAMLSIGRRDARLLKLRELTFGPKIACLTNCPACGESLELSLDISDLYVNPPEPVGEEGDPGEDPLSLMIDGYEVRFRLPNSRDLATATADGDTDIHKARKQLLERCLTEVYHVDDPTAISALPESAIKAVVERMEQADPQANLQIALSCPTCQHAWDAPFDIVSFLWAEISHWAVRMLRDVHTLASHYGWKESDILALPPLRRQAYLELICG